MKLIKHMSIKYIVHKIEIRNVQLVCVISLGFSEKYT